MEKKGASGYDWSVAQRVSSHVRECKLSGLVAEEMYYIRVAAENDVGTGYYREFAEPVSTSKSKGGWGGFWEGTSFGGGGLSFGGEGRVDGGL